VKEFILKNISFLIGLIIGAVIGVTGIATCVYIKTSQMHSTIYMKKRISSKKTPLKLKRVLCNALMVDTGLINSQCIMNFGLSYLSTYPETILPYITRKNTLKKFISIPYLKSVQFLHKERLITTEDINNSESLSYILNSQEII
jgi:hypothetical protein